MPDQDSVKELTEKVASFRDARDWKQFHNPKDCALSLMLEAGELAEHFQWKNVEEMARHVEEGKEDIADELADVFYWVLLIAKDLNIDLPQALGNKLAKNEEKYPIEKSKGSHSKYTEL